MSPPHPVRARAVAALGLERNIVAVSAAVFLLALGENLWKRFIPKYLDTLGAPVMAIGLFGTCQDFLDGVYQYPGGWIGDRYGRRRALVLFVMLAMVGYGLYWWAPTWPFVFAGLVFVMAWSSMASPTLFAVVGDALPKERRAVGFTVQSILRRIPIAVAPTFGGLPWHLALILLAQLRSGRRQPGPRQIPRPRSLLRSVGVRAEEGRALALRPQHRPGYDQGPIAPRLRGDHS